ncbi:MAG TPA: PqqD family peptide modification chaperone [Candidatus Brocadiales bacterium]|nr:PqqD family peptide modification chaperone [Candidatus Brocadiales bacterium]
MVNEVDHAKSHIVLVRGPVNSALYDLGRGEIYTIDPRVVDVLGGVQSLKPSYIGGKALQVLRGYFVRHPALAQYETSNNNSGVSEGIVKSLSCQSGPAGLSFMWLELTNACNLSCAHCYAEAGVRRTNELSHRQWKEILEEGSELGARHVQLTGGETTLYPGLIDLVEYARSCHYTGIEVVTNATRLEDRLLRQWATLGVKVAVSFYSYDPEAHDGITRSPGSFRQTVEGIKALLSYQIPVRANIVLMQGNLTHLKGTREFLEGLGLEEIGHDYVRPTGRGEVESRLVGEGVGKGKPEPNLPRPSERRRRVFDERPCSWITCWKSEIVISSEGVVYPCIFARCLPVGRFPEMRLKEIIQGQAVQKLWQITLDNVETCKDCELRYGCFNCRALALTTTGRLLAKDPRCQYNPYTGLVEGHGGKGMKERPKIRIDLINETVEEEVVIYDPKNHNLHHLNPMAGVIWELCDGNHTPKEIAEEVVSVLETDPVQVERDVTKTIEEFQSKGLLEVV